MARRLPTTLHHDEGVAHVTRSQDLAKLKA
jgi:hypothetical protein